MIAITELIKTIITEYIDKPALLNISEETVITEDDKSMLVITIKTPYKSDIGKLIGKEGKNIEALRRIINTVATKRTQLVNLHIIS
jgi:predicted RNA-binding protein YlqC (UPF0109 family)